METKTRNVKNEIEYKTYFVHQEELHPDEVLCGHIKRVILWGESNDYVREMVDDIMVGVETDGKVWFSDMNKDSASIVFDPSMLHILEDVLGIAKNLIKQSNQ